MKTLGIVRGREPNEHWQAWIAALFDSGFEIKLIHPWTMEDQTLLVSSVDAVLVDGFTPHLSELIPLIHAHCPDAKIIVATDSSSFEVFRESDQVGAFYVTEPESAQHFVQTIRRIVSDNEPAESFGMPGWI